MRRYVDTFRLKLFQPFFDSVDSAEREWEGRRVRVTATKCLGKLKWVETLEADKSERKRAILVHPSAGSAYQDLARAEGKDEGIPMLTGTV